MVEQWLHDEIVEGLQGQITQLEKTLDKEQDSRYLAENRVREIQDLLTESLNQNQKRELV